LFTEYRLEFAKLMQRLPTYFRICVRNVLRQRRRTAIALSAIGFGVVALLIAGGFIGWVLDEMRDRTIRTFYGHLQVARTGYWDNAAADPYPYLIRGTPSAVDRLARDSRVATVAPRLSFAGLISHGDNTLSFLGEAVDPAREAGFGHSMIFNPGRGENLSPGDAKGVVIGQGLAANLGVRMGDTVVLLVNTPKGGVNAVELTIRGIFITVTKAFDDASLRLPLATAQSLLRTDGVQSWTILLHRGGDLDALRDEFRTDASRGNLEMRPWTALADTFLKTEALFGRQLGAIGLLLALLIVLGISNTMTMSVIERTSEIGTAMALGATRRDIMIRFVIEGVVLGLLGGAAGTVVGLALAALLSWVGIPLPAPPGLDTPVIAEIRVDPALAVAAFLTASVSTVLASLYPALRASRLVIVDALRTARL